MVLLLSSKRNASVAGKTFCSVNDQRSLTPPCITAEEIENDAAAKQYIIRDRTVRQITSAAKVSNPIKPHMHMLTSCSNVMTKYGVCQTSSLKLATKICVGATVTIKDFKTYD